MKANTTPAAAPLGSSGLSPATVTAVLPVARALRRIRREHPHFDELTALCHLAETNAALYERFARAIRSDVAFARMTTPLSQFAEGFDSMKSAGTIAA
jgi:hypothetical protein